MTAKARAPMSGAERVRLCRKRLRLGLLLVRLDVAPDEAAALVAAGYLRRGAVADPVALARGVKRLLASLASNG